MLTNKEKRYLKALGGKLEPVVQIGKAGVAPSVVSGAAGVIAGRELIKVRVLKNSPEEPATAIAQLAEGVGAELVQVIGRNGLLFKRNTEKPKIEFPAAGRPRRRRWNGRRNPSRAPPPNRAPKRPSGPSRVVPPSRPRQESSRRNRGARLYRAAKKPLGQNCGGRPHRPPRKLLGPSRAARRNRPRRGPSDRSRAARASRYRG